MIKIDEIRNLLAKFEAASIVVDGVECWSARNLQELMGYSQWRNFENAIDKAKQSCQNAGQKIDFNFVQLNKTIPTGKNAEREISDILLTRYACYLVSQNGDPKKQQIAFAQTYFAVQTRRAEIIEQRLLEYERVRARIKLAQTEKILSGVLYERGVDDVGFATIRSKGDKALFNLSTVAAKRKFGAPDSRPLADYLPTIGIKAKDFAAEMTNVNVQAKDIKGVTKIGKEHIDNNLAVRKMMIQRGITPESLLGEEDVKKVERRLKGEEKKVLKNN